MPINNAGGSQQALAVDKKRVGVPMQYTRTLKIRLLFYLLIAYRVVFWISSFDTSILGQLRDSTDRQSRFPSVEQRIKSYMGDWYLPPCYSAVKIQYDYIIGTTNTSDPLRKSLRIFVPTPDGGGGISGNNNNTTATTSDNSLIASNKITNDVLFFMEQELLDVCTRFYYWVRRFKIWWETNGHLEQVYSYIDLPDAMQGYCRDVEEMLEDSSRGEYGSIASNVMTEQGGIPLLFTFGDVYDLMLPVPHFRKARPATSISRLEHVTGGRNCYSESFQSRPRLISTGKELHQENKNDFIGIVLKLNSERHFNSAKRVRSLDMTWDKKMDAAAFRGVMSGRNDWSLLEGSDVELLNDEAKQCLSVPRCSAVLRNRNSTLVDARLTNMLNRIPGTIVFGAKGKEEYVELKGRKLSMEKQLRYKAIIIIEGNDVASGLKWALYSNSVVMMPEPRATSWALEEMLLPWKHYIPIKKDGSDIKEKMEWILENDLKAQQIAGYGTLWIEDLLFHPDAKEDDRLVRREILTRYAAHFAM